MFFKKGFRGRETLRPKTRPSAIRLGCLVSQNRGFLGFSLAPNPFLVKVGKGGQGNIMNQGKGDGFSAGGFSQACLDNV